MKRSLLALAVCAVAASSFADSGKKATVKTTIHCAVMTTNVVNIAKATKDKNYTDYKGRRYFFCCGDCPDMFKKSPAKFAKAESIKTPKSKKAQTKA